MSLLAGKATKTKHYIEWKILIAVLAALFLHIAVALYFVLEPESQFILPPQASPVVFEVSVVAAPKAPSSALPVGPKQQESAPMTQQRNESEVTSVTPVIPAIAKSVSDFMVKVKQEEPQPKEPEKDLVEKEPSPQPLQAENSIGDGVSEQYIEKTSAPLSMPVKESKVNSGPVKGVLNEQVSLADISWKNTLQVHLERKKRYPRMAKLRRQQGIPWVSFTMDRTGHILDVTLYKESGFAALDKEVLELVRRAEPLPPPPDDVKGDPLTMTVPVEFFIR